MLHICSGLKYFLFLMIRNKAFNHSGKRDWAGMLLRTERVYLEYWHRQQAVAMGSSCFLGNLKRCEVSSGVKGTHNWWIWRVTIYGNGIVPKIQECLSSGIRAPPQDLGWPTVGIDWPEQSCCPPVLTCLDITHIIKAIIHRQGQNVWLAPRLGK